jgi:hypothetical protein
VCFAIFTYSIKVHPVELRRKTIPFHEPFLKVFDFNVDHLDEPAALRADEVIVMTVIVEMLVSGGPVFEPELAAESALT